ncbi:MAG: pyridoxamine 5'-phosphate oxidase [Alphaproteobacteria bacterium]|nr:pyridoxamine 5'-phosphate oxidase [Alphaproteobacteria bacterium]
MTQNQVPFAEPFALFADWFALAKASEPPEAEAMNLATATRDGRPSSRIVLLRGSDERGFVFFTHFDSRKGEELFANPHAALCFHWKSLKRQVRIEGSAEAVSDVEGDAYFSQRARMSQIGAWASDQSRPLDSRATFERRLLEVEARFKDQPVPRPPRWSGFRLVPVQMEFWEERPFRLHDRLVYRRDGDGWTMTRLYP